MVQLLYVKAPVSGVVEEVKVHEGDNVVQGGLLIVQSATKTETQVSAPIAGKVKHVAKRGDTLKEGDILAHIEH